MIRTDKTLQTIFAAAAILAMSIALFQAIARADEDPMIVITPAAAPSQAGPAPEYGDIQIDWGAALSGGSMCGPFDPDCSRRLQRILTGIHVLPLQVSGGVRFGENGTQGAVRFSTQLVGIDVPIGDLNAVMFDAVYLPEAGGMRLRFTLADTEVLFFCTDDEGKSHPPLLALFAACKPEGSFGLGGTVGQFQWDTVTGRVAARWLELQAVYNFLRNGNGLDYLRKRLNAFAGVSADTVWYGSTPNTDGRGHTILRGHFGLTGMLRSANNRWEIRGLAGYRPNVTSWTKDYSIEARAQILRHLLLNRNVMGDIGLDGRYQYNSVPANSMGHYASDRERNSAFLGAIFGVTWQ